MNQLRKCSTCGNTEKFYIRATVVTELIMIQEEDGKIGFITGEDDDGRFLRINSKSANSISNSVGIEEYVKPLRCSNCDTEVRF